MLSYQFLYPSTVGCAVILRLDVWFLHQCFVGEKLTPCKRSKEEKSLSYLDLSGCIVVYTLYVQVQKAWVPLNPWERNIITRT